MIDNGLAEFPALISIFFFLENWKESNEEVVCINQNLMGYEQWQTIPKS